MNFTIQKKTPLIFVYYIENEKVRGWNLSGYILKSTSKDVLLGVAYCQKVFHYLFLRLRLFMMTEIVSQFANNFRLTQLTVK